MGAPCRGALAARPMAQRNPTRKRLSCNSACRVVRDGWQRELGGRPTAGDGGQHYGGCSTAVSAEPQSCSYKTAVNRCNFQLRRRRGG
ncbi:unnamed protein product [Symbiodinium sp. KB8]|nr:unnamed protein product [Symbiodinium sp. KB8]